MSTLDLHLLAEELGAIDCTDDTPARCEVCKLFAELATLQAYDDDRIQVFRSRVRKLAYEGLR